MRIERTLVSLDQFEEIVRNKHNLLQILESEGWLTRLSFAPRVDAHESFPEGRFVRSKKPSEGQRSEKADLRAPIR